MRPALRTFEKCCYEVMCKKIIILLGNGLSARRFSNVKSTFRIGRKFALLKIPKKLNMFEVADCIYVFYCGKYSTLLVKKVLNRVDPIRDDGLRPPLRICNVSSYITLSP